MTLSETSLRSWRNRLWAVLLPLSLLWTVGSFFRRRFYPKSRRYRSCLPVLCVGNIHSGGSGKTPLVLEIASHFRERSPVILSRGYGGSLSSTGGWVSTSDPGGPGKFGDEPWMMAQRAMAPVYVGRNRRQALSVIEKDAVHRLVVLDDGFQHLQVERQIDLVAINTNRSPLDSFCLPLGDLREPVSALEAASAIVLVSDENTARVEEWEQYLSAFVPGIPRFRAIRHAEGLWDGDTLRPLPTGRLAGFCGIAQPESFRAMLEKLDGGALLKVYPDHWEYSGRDVKELGELARGVGATALITTEKDWVKLVPMIREAELPLYALRIGYELSTEFWYFLEQSLERS